MYGAIHDALHDALHQARRIALLNTMQKRRDASRDSAVQLRHPYFAMQASRVERTMQCTMQCTLQCTRIFHPSIESHSWVTHDAMLSSRAPALVRPRPRRRRRRGAASSGKASGRRCGDRTSTLCRPSSRRECRG